MEKIMGSISKFCVSKFLFLVIFVITFGSQAFGSIENRQQTTALSGVILSDVAVKSIQNNTLSSDSANNNNNEDTFPRHHFPLVNYYNSAQTTSANKRPEVFLIDKKLQVYSQLNVSFRDVVQ